MTNLERYGERLKTWASRHDEGLAGNFQGKLVFGKKDGKFTDNAYCTPGFINWLFSEEVPCITKSEKAFLESIRYSYIARNYNQLVVFENKPEKVNGVWTAIWCDDDPTLHFEVPFGLFDISFLFIKFDDEEPWKVSDLLALEVVENRN